MKCIQKLTVATMIAGFAGASFGGPPSVANRSLSTAPKGIPAAPAQINASRTNVNQRLELNNGISARNNVAPQQVIREEASTSLSDANTLSAAERLQFQMDVGANVDANGNLKIAQDAVMKEFNTLTDVAADPTGQHAELLSLFIVEEVNTWTCSQCVIGFGNTLKRSVALVTEASERGTELTPVAAFKGALHEKGKLGEFETQCRVPSATNMLAIAG